MGLEGIKDEQKVSKIKIILSGTHYLIPIFVLLYTLLIEKESPISAAFNSICVLFVLMVVQVPIIKYIHKQKVTKKDFILVLVIFFGQWLEHLKIW